MRLLPKLFAVEREAGKPPSYLNALPYNAGVFTTGAALPSAMQGLKSAFVSALASITPMPSVNTAEGWAFKSTMTAASQFMLAAAAKGLSTLPMEGIDEVRIRRSVGVPSRYRVPVVVALGCVSSSMRMLVLAVSSCSSCRHAKEATHKSPRFDPGDVVKLNEFRVPFEDIEKL